MKTCNCGGKWWRHGENSSMNGQRYRCSRCRKCITVRNGKVSDPKPGRPFKQDWRMAA